jgi:chloramphenicol-sensitive protein RarD
LSSTAIPKSVPAVPQASPDSLSGLIYGLGAYGLWGVIPLYFRLVRHLNPLEVLAHRAVWSFLLLAALVAAFGKMPVAWRALSHRKSLFALVASSFLIAANWLTYIYAVQSEQIVQASLGYFITPLANALIGRVILGERLKRLQIIALGFALAGVLVLTALLGTIPWIALSLAVSFSLYGLMRKTMPADSLVGLFAETLLLSPAALGYLLWLNHQQTGVFRADGNHYEWLLILSGPITCAPLLLFGSAARTLRMVTLGFLQFLAPTIQFLVAVFVFHEDFTARHLVAFSLIWTAVLLYTADSVLRAKK